MNRITELWAYVGSLPARQSTISAADSLDLLSYRIYFIISGNYELIGEVDAFT